MYILPPSISKKIEGYRWQSFTPPAAGKSRRFRGLICHRRSQQSPKELTWLNGVTQACLVCLKEQWQDGFDEATAVARSDWILALSDVRAWTHRLDENVEQLKERYWNWNLLLMTLLATQQQPVKEAYWRWFDSRVLESLQEEDPDAYQYLLEWAKEYVDGSVEASERGQEDGNDQQSR